MKTISLALGALAFATAANAAGMSSHERPQPVSFDRTVAAAQTVDVPAGSVLTSKELRRAGLDADELVSVSLVGSAPVDRGDRFSAKGDN